MSLFFLVPILALIVALGVAYIGIPDATYVECRSTKTPTARWFARVHYDGWGTPYLESQTFGPMAAFSEQTLLANGKTDNWVYGTEWRHHKGPPVVFPPRKQTSAFEVSA